MSGNVSAMHRKLEAMEGRMVKMMAKDDKAKASFEKPYKHIKAALDAANEGNHEGALENVQMFNNAMLEMKQNANV